MPSDEDGGTRRLSWPRESAYRFSDWVDRHIGLLMLVTAVGYVVLAIAASVLAVSRV